MTESSDTILKDSFHQGGPNDDHLFGTNLFDLMIGGLGRDTLKGSGGDDIIVGGFINGAHDILSAEISEEDPSGIFYVETPHPSAFAEVLYGGAGNDLLIGGSWDNIDPVSDSAIPTIVDSANVVDLPELVLGSEKQLEHWGFNNILWGGEGNDTVYGANGFDTIGGSDGDDLLYGFDSADVIYGGAGDDQIFGGEGETRSLHRLDGTPEVIKEELYGGAGNDTVNGEGGDDVIFGGAGKDRLIAGEGNDILTGGAGADTYWVGRGKGQDIVTDFDLGEDRLFFTDVHNQKDLDALFANAEATIVDGQQGLLLSIPEGGSVVLLGLNMAHIGTISASYNDVLS